MFEALQNALNIIWHGDIDVPLVIIPCKCETTVKGSGHVGGDLVFLV